MITHSATIARWTAVSSDGQWPRGLYTAKVALIFEKQSASHEKSMFNPHFFSFSSIWAQKKRSSSSKRKTSPSAYATTLVQKRGHSQHTAGIHQTLTEKPQHTFMDFPTRGTPEAQHRQHTAHSKHAQRTPFLSFPATHSFHGRRSFFYMKGGRGPFFS